MVRLWRVGIARGAALLAAGGLLGLPAPVRAAAVHGPTASKQPIVVDAAVSNVNYQTDTAVFKDIVVSQGDTRVTADQAHAVGLDFKDSRWTFEGEVLMVLKPRGSLRCDQATVRIRDRRIAQATAIGNPAEFEQQRANSGKTLHGHADQIVYDANADTVRLSGHAWLSDGHNEISGPLLVYNMREEKVQALSQGERRGVHIKIARPVPRGKRPARGSGSGPARDPRSDGPGPGASSRDISGRTRREEFGVSSPFQEHTRDARGGRLVSSSKRPVGVPARRHQNARSVTREAPKKLN